MDRIHSLTEVTDLRHLSLIQMLEVSTPVMNDVTHHLRHDCEAGVEEALALKAEIMGITDKYDAETLTTLELKAFFRRVEDYAVNRCQSDCMKPIGQRHYYLANLYDPDLYRTSMSDMCQRVGGSLAEFATTIGWRPDTGWTIKQWREDNAKRQRLQTEMQIESILAKMGDGAGFGSLEELLGSLGEPDREEQGSGLKLITSDGKFLN